MRRRKNKIIAGTVVAVMMAGSIIANISPLIASQTGGNSVAAAFSSISGWMFPP